MKAFIRRAKNKIVSIIRYALAEDIGKGDITTRLLFPAHIRTKAEIIAKEDGVVCGVAVAEEVFKEAEKRIRKEKKKRGNGIRVYCKVKDGGAVRRGQAVCVIEGDARTILAAERTALNFLGRLSGIATLTKKYVDAVKAYKVKIMDTRKTMPGLRELEKYAVKCAGGVNHRMGLYDQILIKDNHLSVLKVKGKRLKVKEVIEGIKRDKKEIKGVKKGINIEIEVQSLRQFKEALVTKPDIIMLDNMKIPDIKKAVAIKNKLSTLHHPLSTRLEVSGGVTLKNVRAIARTGVDMISVGGLTHSARSMDFSLEFGR